MSVVDMPWYPIALAIVVTSDQQLSRIHDCLSRIADHTGVVAAMSRANATYPQDTREFFIILDREVKVIMQA